MVAIIFELSVVVAIAALLALISRAIKQPPIIAYLVAGIVIGPLFFNLISPDTSSAEFIQVFARIGVAFLLFIVGLSLDFRVLKEVGGVSIIGGFIQIAATTAFGYLISRGLGFYPLPSFYIALALAFSSTVVVVKMLSDKREIDTLHGRIALGILIVQDFVAALALMLIPLVGQEKDATGIVQQIALAIGLIVFIFLFANFVFSRLLSYLARSPEVLFLFGIAWALILATAFDSLGFSLEIGALIAGMSLASSKYNLELGGKIKPLRDFFVVLFFVFFGSQLVGPISQNLIVQAIILSLFVIIAKPLFVMAFMRASGYQKRTNFLTGLSLAQISEFSLVLILVGFTFEHITQHTMSLIVLVSLLTIGISSYGIHYSNSIFMKIEKFLFFMGGKKQKIEKEEAKKYDVFIFGYHRIGYKVIESIKKMKVSFVVVDHNPKVIISLTKQGIDSLYGDASDDDFLNEIGLEKAKLVISTIPDMESNLAIQEVLKKENSKAVFIATTEQPRIAFDLYKEGVDYVIVPHHLGGDYIANVISRFKLNKKEYKKIGRKHSKELRKKRNNSTFNS